MEGTSGGLYTAGFCVSKSNKAHIRTNKLKKEHKEMHIFTAFQEFRHRDVTSVVKLALGALNLLS